MGKTVRIIMMIVDDCVKDGGEEFLPKCIVFFNRIPVESLKIHDSNVMHRGKNSSPPFLAQISISMIAQLFVTG